MQIIKSSICYRIIQYVANIHAYSFIYKTRKKESKIRGQRVSKPYYRYSWVHKVMSRIGGLLRKLCVVIHNGAKSSGLVAMFSSTMLAMKKTKLWAFNQLMISIIIGYAITNLAFGIFTKMKFFYLSGFFLLMLGMNIYCMLYIRYKKTSLLVRLYRYVTQ